MKSLIHHIEDLFYNNSKAIRKYLINRDKKRFFKYLSDQYKHKKRDAPKCPYPIQVGRDQYRPCGKCDFCKRFGNRLN